MNRIDEMSYLTAASMEGGPKFSCVMIKSGLISLIFFSTTLHQYLAWNIIGDI